MNKAMLAARRELGVRAVLTLPTGAAHDLGGEDVLCFSVEEGSDSALLPGAVLSARLTLELRNDAGQWRNRTLVGATAQLSVICEETELPCGVFIIDSVSAAERSGAIRLQGSDSIASELSGEFSDTLSYPATLQQVWQHWLSRTRYEWTGALPGGGTEIPAAPEWGQVTLRKAAGWIAQAAGCFLRVNRLGALEMVPCISGEAEALGPEVYWNLEDGFQSWGPVESVQVRCGEESFSVGSGETLLAEGNPLLQNETIARSMLAQVTGLRLEKCSFSWRGEPSVSVGSRIALTDTYGDVKICTVTRQTIKFDRGFSAQVICGVPESDGGVVRAITPEGGLNAGALTGTVNGALLAADSVTARAIAAHAVTAEKLAAGAVTADKLTAGSVTADKLDADTVSARVAKFVAAQMEKLTAGEIETDELYAAFAHVIGLSAESLSAGNAQIDVLASALAEFVSLHAATGEFDFAAIQNLVSKALSLDQGAMDTVYIKNLAVTGANMLSATLGKLVVKGDDGKYYRLFVSADGRISAEETQDVGAEIDGGGQVVETNMNVGSLNAMDLQAGSAVINSILTTALSAGSITAADAMIASATIPALYATTIEAIGNSLQLLTGGSSRVFRGETAPSGAKVGDLWIQPSQGFIHQRAEEVLPEFYLLGSDLYYAGSEYALAMDDSGDLYAQGILPYIPAIAAGGTLTAWMRVKDGELDKAAQDALDSSRENAAVIAEHAAEIALMRGEIALRVTEAVYQETAEGLRQQIERNGSSIELLSDRIGSQVSAGRLDEITGEMEESISRIVQRADSIEATLTEKVDGEELRSYIRYEDGAVEIGSSGSRYAARTSDTGFTVLQDGAVMTSMVKNTVSAPVLEARRQFQLGRFSIRAGNDGGLLIL